MILVENLIKRYQQKTAVNGISFQVQPGEIFGLLGTNGAGKSTTMKILATLTQPDSGSVCIHGEDIAHFRSNVRRKVALVPQEENLERELSVQQNLLIHACLYCVPKPGMAVANIIRQFALQEVTHSKVAHLSGGLRRRLLIARALLQKPEIVLMDEPSLGLDPQVRHDIWDIIRGLREEGVTIVLTTHYMDEAEMLCDHIGILSQGTLTRHDTLANICASVGTYCAAFHDGIRLQRLCTDDPALAQTFVAGKPHGVVRATRLEDAFIALTSERSA